MYIIFNEFGNSKSNIYSYKGSSSKWITFILTVKLKIFVVSALHDFFVDKWGKEQRRMNADEHRFLAFSREWMLHTLKSPIDGIREDFSYSLQPDCKTMSDCTAGTNL